MFLKIGLFVLALLVVYKVYRNMKIKRYYQSLPGKTVLVTGGGSGIGREVCLRYLELGCNVAFCGRRLERLEETKNYLLSMVKGAEKRIAYFKADCAEQEDCKNFILNASERFGAIDILVLNHLFGRIQKFDEIDENSIELAYNLTYNANVKGNMLLLHYAIPHLTKTKGKILYVSSMSSYYGVAKLSLYSSSKLAMHGFLSCLRLEISKKEIQITICSPGLIGTDIARTFIGEKEMKGSMSPTKCAFQMVEAVGLGDRECLMNVIDSPPINGTIFFWLSQFFPQLVELIGSTSPVKDAIMDHPTKKEN